MRDATVFASLFLAAQVCAAGQVLLCDANGCAVGHAAESPKEQIAAVGEPAAAQRQAVFTHYFFCHTTSGGRCDLPDDGASYGADCVCSGEDGSLTPGETGVGGRWQ